MSKRIDCPVCGCMFFHVVGKDKCCVRCGTTKPKVVRMPRMRGAEEGEMTLIGKIR